MRTLCLIATLWALASTANAAPRRLTLAQAVELALQSDPTLAQAQLQRDRSAVQALRAQLDRVSLKVDGSLQTLFNKANIGGPSLYRCDVGGAAVGASPEQCALFGGVSSLASQQQPENSFGMVNLEATLNVPIFAGFGVESNVRRANKVELASLAEVHQARKDVALAVMRAYWQLRRLGLLLEVQQRSVERLVEAEAVVRGRVGSGLAAPIDHNRAALRRLQATAAIAELTGQEREAAVQLAVALHVSDEVVLADEPNVPEAAPPPLQRLLSEARERRPELNSAQLQLEAQQQSVKIAMSNYYPQLRGFGSFALTNNPFNYVTGARMPRDTLNPFDGVSGNVTVGLLLSINLFDTLNTWTATKDARFEEHRRAQELSRQTRIVDADVRLAHTRLQQLYHRRAPLLEALEVARDNLTILEARYTNGEALVIEYLEGQNDLITAEQQVVDVTAQLQQAWYELEASLGRVVGVDS
jgi:outer membrane protein